MKTIIIMSGLAIFLLAGGAWWSNNLPSNSSDVVARNGIHWHPQLEIYVNGEKVEIPESVGLGAIHLPMHTHDDLPLIHLEFPGTVKEKDLALGQFFKNWGKEMRSFGANMKMIVNGQENVEYENYVMRDRDKIELRFN